MSQEIRPAAASIKRNAAGSKSGWRRLRRAVQILAFILFLALTFSTLQGVSPFFHDLFFDLDPLLGIAAMLASKTLIVGMLWGLFTLVLTLLLGRVWCGWICPMGSLLDWIPAHKTSRKDKDIPSYWRQVKYLLLFIILAAALFGSLTLIFLDPITLVFRTLASSILPGLSFILDNFEDFLNQVTFLQPLAGWFGEVLRPWLITQQPFYWPNLILLAFFVAVLALNAFRDRFWCRYLCPLGGLLALVAKLSVYGLQVNAAGCRSCGMCATVCPTGAIDAGKNYEVKTSECIMCMSCVDSCQFHAYEFKKLAVRKAEMVAADPSRRQFLYSLGAGIAGALLLRYLPLVAGRVRSFLRPPGATEDSLQDKCIRCGECIKVCPTGVIQPGSSAEGWDRLWMPEMKMRHASCDYNCNACGQVCPTAAIPLLSLAEKKLTVIGKARIDETRCIPYAEGENCTVCEEACPVPNKAIRFTASTVTDSTGQTVNINLPSVVNSRCIGCGVCEKECPVAGESAIQVYAEGVASKAGGSGGGNGGQGRRGQQ